MGSVIEGKLGHERSLLARLIKSGVLHAWMIRLPELCCDTSCHGILERHPHICGTLHGSPGVLSGLTLGR